MSTSFPKVLLIVQDATLRQLYHELLLKEEWEVVVAFDAASGLLELVNHAIDLVLLDGQIPGDECVKVMEIMSEKEQWCSLPIVLLNFDGPMRVLRKPCDKLAALVPVETTALTPGDIARLVRDLLEGRFTEI